MGDLTEVVLVDGCGRPKILSIKSALVLPIIIKFPHPIKVTEENGKESQVMVEFIKDNQVTLDGRQVYRQSTKGSPEIRAQYLKLSTIPRLRLEEKTAPRPENE